MDYPLTRSSDPRPGRHGTAPNPNYCAELPAFPPSRCTSNPRVCERRSRYRRDHYREYDREDGPHPVTAEAERRALLGEGRARLRRMLALSRLLSGSQLPDPARRTWLELERLLHAHWLEVAREHFNLGVEAGLELERDLELPPKERLFALVEALRKAIDAL